MEPTIYTRGDIIYVTDSILRIGCEIGGGRPAIIVSRDRYNFYSDVVEIVYLTSKDKKPMPSHVRIHSYNRMATALCEQVSSIDKIRIGSVNGHCSQQEMMAIDQALLYSLGLS